jgi:hypothetical protein
VDAGDGGARSEGGGGNPRSAAASQPFGDNPRRQLPAQEEAQIRA